MTAVLRRVMGDATLPLHVQNKTVAILAHICNNSGYWGAGFVVPLGRLYPEARYAYLGMIDRHLGRVQYVHANSSFINRSCAPQMRQQLVIANMIAQAGITWKRDGTPPIDYAALRACLGDVAKYVANRGVAAQAVVHMPKIGTGLAGGRWHVIEPLIRESLVAKGIDVLVYTLPSRLVPDE